MLRIITALLTLTPANALAGDVSLTSTDGVSLHAQHWGSGSTGVVLVHGARGSASDWGTLGEKLAGESVQVLALDLRGHGQSTGLELDQTAYQAMTADVSGAVDWLRAHGAGQVVVIGAGLGANLALASAANDADVDSIVMLSPGFNIEGVTVGAIDQYGARPLLVVSAAEDAYATRTSGVLQDRATGDKHWKMVPGNAAGTRMVARDADLEGLLFAWVHGTVFATADGGKVRELGTVGDLSEVETNAVRLEDR